MGAGLHANFDSLQRLVNNCGIGAFTSGFSEVKVIKSLELHVVHECSVDENLKVFCEEDGIAGLESL